MRVEISQKVVAEIKKKKPFVLRAGDLIWKEVEVLHWHPICERCKTQITKFLDIENHIWQCDNHKCKNSKGKHNLHEIVWEKESEGE